MASPHRMVIFDDGHGQFGPMTDLRAVFEVRTGMLTTAGRLMATYPRKLAGYWTNPRLEALVGSRANAPVNELPEEETIRVVNGRWALPDRTVAPDVGDALTEASTGDVIIATLRRADAEHFLETGELHDRIHRTPADGRQLYRTPWDILDTLPAAIAHDVGLLVMPDAIIVGDVALVRGEHAVDIHPTAHVGAHVVLDATAGPVYVREHVTIGHGAVLCGPCAVARGAKVMEQAVLKPNTVIGPQCRVGGEIGGTIFQGYANKAHHGHLGDSWIGKWVNLGAGTVNSNLLNTYQPVTVRLEPTSPRLSTGRTFFGSVIGDHVKTAVGTRLMTGTVIGTGAMIACTQPPPTSVARFAWMTDRGTADYRHSKFVEVTRSVMARREKEPSGAYLAALELLHGNAPNGAE